MKSNQPLLHSETLFQRNIENIFPVAGIGASAGGLDAFKTLIKSIPAYSGIAWVFVQHQHPSYESMLTELLQKVTSLPVIQITNNLLLKPNQIFVMPANKMLTVKDGKLKLSPRPKDKIEGNYPINLFFTSLAQAYESNAIGVVLSGTASDGTKGLQAIKEHGGITIAQSIASSAYAGMPESAIGAGMVDFILEVDKIPIKLLDIKKITSIDEEKGHIPEEDENSFKEILSLLHLQRNMDFTFYKQTTIRRRILRRMVINKYKKIDDYKVFLKENKNEVNALYQDMLIPVTSFFRDEKVFNNLCETVFPNLIKNKSADGLIRIWVAGCSTGEEAYSIAICFKEYLGHKKEKVQIFATDLSEPAIAKARAGIYTKSEAELVSHHRLKKFFTLHQGNYLVNKDLRDMCVFAVHNFLKDPPFVKLDFISCRNVLIYMDTYLQKKALTTFHYALNPRGLLMLGKSENTVGITDLFITNNKIEKIFTRKNVTPKIPFAITKHMQPVAATLKKNTMPESIRTDFNKIADEMLEKYTPAAVVVNEALDIVHFRGNTSLYLETQGKPTNNLLKMAKTGLAFELRSILHRAIKEKKAVKKENIPVKIQNTQQHISLEATPLSNMVEPHWLIVFNDSTKAKANPSKAKDSSLNKNDDDTLRLQQLEQELAQLREDMRSITEEQETSNEELQSTNEELLSSNEEMQSLNEELETSKEEMQSTVEELTVVNQEMVNLNEQLTSEKEYADAIISTIPQPLLILDKELRVTLANELFYKKFLVNKSQTEEKLVYEIGNRQWDIEKLRTLLEKILPDKKSLLGFEVEHNFETIGQRNMRLNAREITRVNGEKRILLVIEDVTDYVQAARKIEESEHRYANMVFSSPSMIAILYGEDMIIKIANDTILETWGKGKNIIGKSLFEVMPEILEQGFKELLLNVYYTGIPYRAVQRPVYVIRNGKKELTYYTFIYQAQKDTNGNIEGVAIIATDVTSEAALNEQIKHSDEKFKAAVAAVEGIVWTNNGNGEMEGEQSAWASLTGQTYEEYQGYGWAKAVHPDDAQPTVDAWQEAVQNKSTFIFEHRLKLKDGNWGHFSIRAIPLINNDGSIREWVGVHTDITEKLQAEQLIKESEEKFRTMAESSDILIGVNNESVNAVYFNKSWEKLTGRSVDDLLNLGWADLLHPEDKEPFMNKFLTAFNNKESYDGEFRMLNKEGTYSCLYAKVQVRLHPDGSYAGHISSCIDITERKKNESS